MNDGGTESTPQIGIKSECGKGSGWSGPKRNGYRRTGTGDAIHIQKSRGDGRGHIRIDVADAKITGPAINPGVGQDGGTVHAGFKN